MKTSRPFGFLLITIFLFEIFNLSGEYFLNIHSTLNRILISVSALIIGYVILRRWIYTWLLPNENNLTIEDVLNIDSSAEYNDTQKLKIITREMKKQIYDLHNLFEISVNLTSILDYEQLLHSCLLSTIGQLQTTGAIIFLPSSENDGLFSPSYTKGIAKRKLNDLRIHSQDPVIQYFRQRSVPVHIRDLAQESDKWTSFEKAGIRLLAPILHERDVLGIIALCQKMNSIPFSQAEMELFSLMTNIFSVTISNAKLYKKMETISVTDELTGLYNYRFFKQQLQDEIARAKRFKHLLSLVILDVDHFKKYNDTYGHPAGDAVLRQLGNLLKETARQTDIVSRYGGEEFCAILPEVDNDGAWYFGERLRKKIESHKFSNKNIEDLGKVTISIGAASFPHDAKLISDLLEKADAALYRAKHMGRNRVCLYSDDKQGK